MKYKKLFIRRLKCIIWREKKIDYRRFFFVCMHYLWCILLYLLINSLYYIVNLFFMFQGLLYCSVGLTCLCPTIALICLFNYGSKLTSH